jgi:hypothetical protein
MSENHFSDTTYYAFVILTASSEGRTDVIKHKYQIRQILFREWLRLAVLYDFSEWTQQTPRYVVIGYYL